MSTRRITRRARLAMVAAGAVVVAGLGWLPSPAYADVGYDLWAVSGTTTMPHGEEVTVWSYKDSNTPAVAPGGPTLTATVGEQISITLHNQIGEPTGLLIQGQSIPGNPMVPDLSGIANGGERTYTFTPQRPGTFLYEAAPIPGAQHQPAMGLYGALVVSPAAAGRAYPDPGTAYDSDQVLLLGEIDPRLNNAANPAGFDMRDFRPTYFTINGLAYPDTQPIVADPGTTQLLRYVNAGMSHHSMAVLGAEQKIIAIDGAPLQYPNHFVADTMGPGQTLDTLVTVPAAQGVDTELFVYDASNSLHNSNNAGIGGMLTSIPVPEVTPAADGFGPVVSGTMLTDGTLTATVDDSGDHGGSTIQAAEYYRDDLTGTGTAMDAADTTFNGVSEDVTADVPEPPAAVPAEYVYYVRGQDAEGNWGPFTSVLVNGADTGGPSTISPILTPNRANGANTQGVKVSATANDSDAGNSAIAAAEYFIDAEGADGTGTAMAVSPAGASIASIDATIPPVTLDALPEGNHPVFIHAQDADGNWGTAISANLAVDETGPQALGISVEPTPNNGTRPYRLSVRAVRVIATTMTDPISGNVNSPIAQAEAFIGVVGPEGSGIPLVPSNGDFRLTTEGGYADIPLSTVRQLTEGEHTIHVRARDAAGNWGTTAGASLVVDKTSPIIAGLSALPSPTNGAAEVALTGTATDASALDSAEWWLGADPGRGNGTAMTLTDVGGGSYEVTTAVPVAGLSDDSYTLRTRVRDAAGNWSAVSATTLQVTGPLAFSTLGNASPRGLDGSGNNAYGYDWSGSAYALTMDLTAAPYVVPATANVDGLSRVDATHFYVSFERNTRLPGLGRVQDEDVVSWNDGAWSLFFDGTAHGLKSPKEDIDAVSVVDDTLYFSTRGNVTPPRVRGRADNADIYRWDGRRYQRVFDASTHGVPGAANVDGYDHVGEQHFYLSFEATTRVRGLGKVQDEDVVAWSGGKFSVYFDGTAHGMAGKSHDVDGLDVP